MKHDDCCLLPGYKWREPDGRAPTSSATGRSPWSDVTSAEFNSGAINFQRSKRALMWIRLRVVPGARADIESPNCQHLHELFVARGFSAMFRYSTLGGGENAPAPAASELIEIARRRPVWDEITIAQEDTQLPRASLSWHEGHGLVLHCFEDKLSLGFFLAESGSLTAPEVDIVLGGQVQERWPRQLFVDPSLGAEALDHFLETGKQKDTLHWVRTDAFLARLCGKGERAERRAERLGRRKSANARDRLRSEVGPRSSQQESAFRVGHGGSRRGALWYIQVVYISRECYDHHR